jgi:hypothetical protein
MYTGVLNYIGQRVRQARLLLRPALLATQDCPYGTARVPRKKSLPNTKPLLSWRGSGVEVYSFPFLKK